MGQSKQNEWKLTTDGEANFFGIATDKGWLMRIQQNGELSASEQKANAQRIVKCVNMHDELLNTLKRALNDFRNGRWTEETYNVIEAQIKQAEQK